MDGVRDALALPVRAEWARNFKERRGPLQLCVPLGGCLWSLVYVVGCNHCQDNTGLHPSFC